MALESDGQLYLFGARDPSVIPEPASAVLVFLAFVGISCGRMRRGL
jgi:hypothetical protein